MKKALIILSITLAIISCKKEVDSPPENVLTDGQIITMDSLLAMYDGSPYKFENDISVFATVTMDEVDGNVYKNIFIQNGSSAINMRLQSSGDLYVGDYIRINLNGTVLSKFSGVMQLDSVDFATNIAVQETNQPLTPSVVTIEELNTSFINLLASEPANPNMLWEFGSRLIKLENVQFSASAIGGTYADGPAQQSLNLILEDCNGNQIIVRSSGYSNFANELVAEGNGELTAVVSRYNDEMQIYIRSFSEINMTDDRCVGVSVPAGSTIIKDFNDDEVTSGGWTTYQVSGQSVVWETSSAGGAASTYLKIQNWDGSANTACENWFISPFYSFDAGSSPKLSFGNDVNYAGAPLNLLISTDFDGFGNPNSANWVDLTGLISWDPNTSAWGFSNTGDIDLSQFSGQSIYIAFKYTGSSSDGSTWELDDIIITG